MFATSNFRLGESILMFFFHLIAGASYVVSFQLDPVFEVGIFLLNFVITYESFKKELAHIVTS